MKTLLGFAFWATVFVIGAFVVGPYLLSLVEVPEEPILTPTPIEEFTPYIIIDVPQPSEDFDCDDATLYMYDYFSAQGIQVNAYYGNLNMTGERWTKQETNHVWLLVNYDGQNNNNWVAYDWGYPYLDEQHYEGYRISYEELCELVEYDRNYGAKK